MMTNETAERFIKAANALTAALNSSPKEPELRMINIPTSADEAEAMEKTGFAWLREHAPERLTPFGLARPIPAPAPLPVAFQSLPYQTLFNAIAAATKIEGGAIAISVETFLSALASEMEDDVDKCPICAEAFKPDDTCATDIELGICHAACLEGAPTVDLDTGAMIDGPIPTYLYSEVDAPPANGAGLDPLAKDA